MVQSSSVDLSFTALSCRFVQIAGSSARIASIDPSKQSKKSELRPDLKNDAPDVAETTSDVVRKSHLRQIVAGLWLKCGTIPGIIRPISAALQTFSHPQNAQGNGLSRILPNRFALRDVFLKKHR